MSASLAGKNGACEILLAEFVKDFSIFNSHFLRNFCRPPQNFNSSCHLMQLSVYWRRFYSFSCFIFSRKIMPISLCVWILRDYIWTYYFSSEMWLSRLRNFLIIFVKSCFFKSCTVIKSSFIFSLFSTNCHQLLSSVPSQIFLYDDALFDKNRVPWSLHNPTILLDIVDHAVIIDDTWFNNSFSSLLVFVSIHFQQFSLSMEIYVLLLGNLE